MRRRTDCKDRANPWGREEHTDMRNVRTDIWVAALVRRAQLGGAFAVVVRRGDAERGEAVVKVLMADRQARLYVPAPPSLDGEAQAAFSALPGPDASRPEPEIDELVARRIQYDRDLWVVEIEDRDGRSFLTEAIAG